MTRARCRTSKARRFRAAWCRSRCCWFAYYRQQLMPVTVFGVSFHLTVLLFAASGSLMISKTLHVPKP